MTGMTEAESRGVVGPSSVVSFVAVDVSSGSAVEAVVAAAVVGGVDVVAAVVDVVAAASVAGACGRKTHII